MPEKEIAPPEETLEKDLDEVLKEVPEEQRKIVEQLMVSSVQMGRISSPETEVMRKITPEHISAYLAASEEDMKKSYEDKKSRRKFRLALSFLSMIFVLAIIIILKDSPDIMEKVLYAGGGFVAGIAGGYGLSKRSQDD